MLTLTNPNSIFISAKTGKKPFGNGICCLFLSQFFVGEVSCDCLRNYSNCCFIRASLGQTAQWPNSPKVNKIMSKQ